MQNASATGLWSCPSPPPITLVLSNWVDTRRNGAIGSSSYTPQSLSDADPTKRFPTVFSTVDYYRVVVRLTTKRSYRCHVTVAEHHARAHTNTRARPWLFTSGFLFGLPLEAFTVICTFVCVCVCTHSRARSHAENNTYNFDGGKKRFARNLNDVINGAECKRESLPRWPPRRLPACPAWYDRPECAAHTSYLRRRRLVPVFKFVFNGRDYERGRDTDVTGVTEGLISLKTVLALPRRRRVFWTGEHALFRAHNLHVNL